MVASSSKSVNGGRRSRPSNFASLRARIASPRRELPETGGRGRDQISLTHAARRIAGRLEELGHDPFQSDRHRYLVLLEDAPGEIIELGRPLRGSRLFKKSCLARDIATVRSIEGFAADCRGEDWLFWNVSLTGAKANVGSLVEANAEFNRLINIQFTEMRRRNSLELILLVIHPRYDPVSLCFDLHAHFICRIPSDQREAARRRLLTAFSKADVPDDPVLNVAGCATYMIWGIAPPDETVELPADALSDLWRLSLSKARLVRTGRRFGEWKRTTAGAVDDYGSQQRKRIRENRAETADPRQEPQWHDRLIAKVKATVGGKKVAALLFEERSAASDRDGAAASEVAVDSSSATIDITQDSMNDTVIGDVPPNDVYKTDAPTTASERGIGRSARDRTRKLIETGVVVVARTIRASTTWLRESVRRLSCWCRGSPR